VHGGDLGCRDAPQVEHNAPIARRERPQAVRLGGVDRGTDDQQAQVIACQRPERLRKLGKALVAADLPEADEHVGVVRDSTRATQFGGRRDRLRVGADVVAMRDDGELPGVPKVRDGMIASVLGVDDRRIGN
jgi:hypothetical protein